MFTGYFKCLQVKISRLELLLATIFHNLNKRLPSGQHIDTDKSISLLLSFLVGAYDRLFLIIMLAVVNVFVLVDICKKILRGCLFFFQFSYKVLNLCKLQCIPYICK